MQFRLRPRPCQFRSRGVPLHPVNRPSGNPPISDFDLLRVNVDQDWNLAKSATVDLVGLIT